MGITETHATATPGPWQICHRHEIEIGNFIAVRPVNDEPPVAYVADSVDARLIAAAPDLLDALKMSFCQACDRYYTVPPSVHLCSFCAKQRAAIAKAEGK